MEVAGPHASQHSPGGPQQRPPIRNRCKARHFDRIFSSLSDGFKKHWEGLNQRQRADVINSGFDKVESRLVPKLEENFYQLQEQHKRTQQRQNLWQGKAVLEEMAAKKLGGPDKFQGPMH